MTDLEKLKALLTSWGVTFRQHLDTASGLTDVVVGGYYPNTQKKVSGYPGFYTSTTFDSEGKFVVMGAWE